MGEKDIRRGHEAQIIVFTSLTIYRGRKKGVPERSREGPFCILGCSGWVSAPAGAPKSPGQAGDGLPMNSAKRFSKIASRRRNCSLHIYLWRCAGRGPRAQRAKENSRFSEESGERKTREWAFARNTLDARAGGCCAQQGRARGCSCNPSCFVSQPVIDHL